MKTLALTIVFLATLPAAMPGASDDTKSFVEHFHDDTNISSYVATVDEIINAGEARIYASMEDEKTDSRSPRARTPNGILMLYTVTHTPDGVLVHFSTSRAPYLPPALGKHIVGLFMARAGWPKPALFSVSDHQVFHAVWMMPATQFDQIKAALPEIRGKMRASEDANAAFLRGLLRSRELDEKKPSQALPTTAPSGRG